MASGRPVIAYKAGGALETVVDGETGLFFEEQTAAALMLAVNRLRFETFDKQKLRQHALQFDKEIFKRKIADFIAQRLWERKK